MIENFGLLLDQVRSRSPLVHQITNFVTMNDCANFTLAIGASPIMADSLAEAAEIAGKAQALVLNLGTPNPARLDAMLAAGQAANSSGAPVVFDPVGAGISNFRSEAAQRLLSGIRISVLRANLSEARFLAGFVSGSKGVDAAPEPAPH